MSSFILTKPEKLRLFLCCIFLGIFCGREGMYAPILLLIGCAGIWTALYWKNIWIGSLSTILLAFCFGSYMTSIEFLTDELISLQGEELEIKGVVSNFADQREDNTRVIVQSHNPKGNFLLILPPQTDIHYGDQIQVTGKLTRPVNFEGFDYQEYLKRFGVQTILRNPNSFEILPQKGGFFLLKMAEKTRLQLAQNLEHSLPSPHSKIAMGILLGVKNELPEFTQEDFKNSGLQHLLVVSGFNVSVVLLFISFAFKHFGRRIVWITSLLALIFFIAMTGAESPILRAGIMGGLTGWAIANGRFSDAKNVFLLSLVLIGLQNPRIIQTDIGFFLSASATFGILYGVPILERYVSRIPNIFELRTLFIVTLTAQISVFPILGLFFHDLPIIGLISNLLAEPVIPLGMLFSFIASLLGFLPKVIASIIGIPSFVLLEILLIIARFFGKMTLLHIPYFVSILGLCGLFLFFIWGNFPRIFFFLKSEKLPKT